MSVAMEAPGVEVELPASTLDASFFTPNRKVLLMKQGYFEIPLKELASHVSESHDCLMWYARRECSSRSDSAKKPFAPTNKKGKGKAKKATTADKPRQPMFHYVLGWCSQIPYHEEVYQFLTDMFVANEQETSHIAAAMKMPNCMCQLVFANTQLDAKTADHRVVVGACLFHTLDKIAFVSYIGRFQGLFTRTKFGRKKNAKDPYTNFEHIHFATLFFHLAQLHVGVEQNLPMGTVVPLYLQVCRKELATCSHKRTGLQPVPIRKLPKEYWPSGKQKNMIPLIVNDKEQDFLQRMITLCLEGTFS